MAANTVKEILKAKLISRAGVLPQEVIYANLTDYLDDAVVEQSLSYLINGLPNYEAIPVRLYDLVVILAWIRVCEARASNAAAQPSLKGVGAGFGSDRDSPFSKNMAMVKYLREKYSADRTLLETNESEDGAGDITIGELYRPDELVDAGVPFRSAPAVIAPVMSVGAILGVAAGTSAGDEGGSVILNWESVFSPYFDELLIFRSSTAGIYQSWNGEGSNSVPFVSTAATQIFSTHGNLARGLKSIGLSAGTYYYVLALRDTAGRFTFSIEQKVIIPA